MSHKVPNVIELGLIDVESGKYTTYSTYRDTKINLEKTVVDFRLLFSPDFRRIATTRAVNGSSHAGWIDSEGNFQDIDQSTQDDPFGGDHDTNAIGFDGNGDFYYLYIARQGNSDTKDVYALPKGQNVGPGSLVPGQRTDSARPHLRGDGTFQSGIFGCEAQPNIGWLNAETILSPKDSQIYLTDFANAEDGDYCSTDPSDALLPASNTATVRDPVGSPDGLKVAFFYKKGSIYITNYDGVGQPREVQVAGVDLDDSFTLLGWI